MTLKSVYGLCSQLQYCTPAPSSNTIPSPKLKVTQSLRNIKIELFFIFFKTITDSISLLVFWPFFAIFLYLIWPNLAFKKKKIGRQSKKKYVGNHGRISCQFPAIPIFGYKHYLEGVIRKLLCQKFAVIPIVFLHIVHLL